VHWRQDRKFKNKTQTNDTTFSEALPESGVLLGIMLGIRVQNSSAQYDRPKRNIHDLIESIIVKEAGIKSFKDVWGPTVIAEWLLQYGKLPPSFIDQMSANYSFESFPIMFGRYWLDPLFGLDLSKHNEVRLEVKNVFASADLQSTTSIFYDVDYYFLEEGIAPANFISTSQIKSHTWTGNSQEETFKVPKDHKVRRILIGCESYPSSGTGGPSNKCHRNARHLKYMYKTGKDIIMDDDLYRHDQYQPWGFPDFAEIIQNVEPRVGYTIDSMLGRPTVAQIQPSYSADPGADYPCVLDQRMERWLTVRRRRTSTLPRPQSKS